MMPYGMTYYPSRILKTDLRTSHIPIVLLTAQSTMEQKIEGIQTGADAYVTKPFNLDFLSEIIKTCYIVKYQRLVSAGSFQPSQLPSGMGGMDEQFLRKFTPAFTGSLRRSNLTVESLE